MTARTARIPNPIDVAVGSRLRERRETLGYSQLDLAALLGETDRQPNKFESGETSVNAELLFRLCIALECRPNYFFQKTGLVTEDNSFGFEEFQRPYDDGVEHRKLISQIIRDARKAERSVQHRFIVALEAELRVYSTENIAAEKSRTHVHRIGVIARAAISADPEMRSRAIRAGREALGLAG